MKLCILIPLCCLLSVPSFSQNIPSDSLKFQVPNPELSIDGKEKVDSLESSFYQKSESLKQAYRNKFAKMDSVQQRLSDNLNKLTSLQFGDKNGVGAGKIDSMQTSFQSKGRNLPGITHLKRSLDSINRLRDSTLIRLNSKLESLKEETIANLNQLNLPPELSEKISSLTNQIEGFQIPSTDLNIPSFNLPNGTDGVQVSELNLPTVERVGISQVDELKNVTGDIGGLSETSKQVSSYGKEFKSVTTGDLSDLKELQNVAETKAEKLSALGEVHEQTQVMDKYKELGNSMQSPDSLKQFAVEEVRQAAVNHFAGHEQQLREAMETVSKYKLKYSSVSNISEITKKPPNEMKGKPFIERLSPGIAMQIQKKGEDLIVDFNPYVGYRFTGRIMAGFGWNKRVAYDVDNAMFNPDARIYGPRVFGEFKLWKGFSPRIEVEVMNTNVPSVAHIHTVDPYEREWVWGLFTGLKKEYRIIKNVKGTAMVMMRLFNPDRKSPYNDVVNVRFGFEFPFKKVAPKT
jgi:hypothetical protein